MLNYRYLFLLFLISASRLFATDYFVDGESGSDTNDGLSLGTAFATIAQASSVLQAGDRCFIREGVYRETIRPANSGQTGQPIHYLPYSEETVVVSAAEPVTGWEAHTHNGIEMWRASLAGNGLVDRGQLYNLAFVDGRMHLPARYPDLGGDVMTAPDVIAEFNDSNDFVASIDFAKDTNNFWAGGVVSGHVPRAFTRQFAKITASDTSGKLTIGDRTLENFDEGTGSAAIWATKNALNAGGEWVVEGGYLYMIGPNGDTPENYAVELKQRDRVLDLSQRQFIQISGLQFRGGVLYAEATEDAIIEDCEFSANGHWLWVEISRDQGLPVPAPLAADGNQYNWIGGQRNIIRNNVFDSAAMHAVILRNDNHVFDNNLVMNSVYMGGFQTAVHARNANNLTFTNNSILRSGGAGIHLGRQGGIYRYNLFKDVMYLRDDGGFVYTIGIDNGNGAEFAYNKMFGMHANYGGDGIYFDHACDGYVVHHNLVVGCPGSGIRVNGPAHNMQFFNNTLWDVEYAVSMWNPDFAQAQFGDDTITNLVFQNNLAQENGFNSGWLRTGGLTGGSYIYNNTVGNNLKINDDSGFVDVAGGDFGLLPASPAVDYGTVVAPYTDGFDGLAPDAGAFEGSTSDFSAGVSLEPLVLIRMAKSFFGDTEDMTFTFERTGDLSASLLVEYQVGGSAVAGVDYLALSGQLTIPAGSATADLVVDLIETATVDSGASIVITVLDGTGYRVGNPLSQTGLVVDSGVVSPSEISLTLLPDTTTNETIYLTNPYTDKSLNFRIVKDADYVYDYSEITPLFDFIWQDIKEGGTAVAVPLNSNAEIIGTSYAIGFDFPFYGSSFQRVWLSTIGGILLDTEISGRNLTDDLAKLPYTTYFPKSTGPGNMIAAYLDGDIKADEQSALFVKQVDADTFVIQCENFTYHPRSGDSWTMALDESMRMTWQVHLKRSGDVFFYLKEHAVASDGKTNDEFSIGLQNADGSQGLEVFRANAFYLRGFPLDQSYTPHDQLGIHIRAPQEWFAYSQQDITVPPAGQAQVILSLDAQGLGDGETLSATVRVQTDDETLNAIPLQIALQIDDTNHAVASEINALTPYKQARAHGDVVNGYYNAGSIGLDKSNVGYNVPSSFQWKNFVVFDVSALLDDLSAASSIRFSTNYSWGGGGSLGWRHVFLGAYDDADFTDALMRYSGMGDDLRFEMAGTLLGMADPDNGGVNYAADYDVADLVRASVDPSHPYLWFRVEGAGHPGDGVDASGAISNPTLEITVPAFEVWKRGQVLPNGIGTPDSDEDSDGRSLAEEFLMGGDPAVADNPITEFQFFVGTLSGQNYMDFQFPVREGSEGSYSFEYSANLNAWNPVMLTDMTGASPEEPATGFIIKRYRLIPTEESETGHFLRMRLEP